MANFPDVRLRRLRERAPVRNMARETRLSVKEFVYPVFVTHGSGVRGAHRADAGLLPPVVGHADRGSSGSCGVGRSGHAAVRASRGKRPFGNGGLRPGGHSARSHQGHQEDHTRHDGDYRRLHVRVHRSRALRRHRKRTGRQRPDAGIAGPDRGIPRPVRGRLGGAFGNDGRPSVGHSPGVGPPGLHRHADHGLRSEIRLGLLRAVPGGGRVRPPVRRPTQLPDGPGQRPHGHAGNRRGHCGGGGHSDGEAGPGLPGCNPPSAGQVRASIGRLQRERRILDDQGSVGPGLGRRKDGHSGDANRHQTGRGRHNPELPCKGPLPAG